MAHVLAFKAQFSQNKMFQHPVLGKISCQSYLETFRECVLRNTSTMAQKSTCDDLYEMTNQCYSSKDIPELQKWIDEKLQNRKKFLEYLRGRHSTLLPTLQTYSSWNIFNPKTATATQRPYSTPQYDENMKFIRESEQM